MYRISFQQIHSFLALAKTLNFTETAESLYLSQPALSKQTRVLEEELGFSLFTRNKRSVCLTPEGESLYRDWQVLENMMNSSIYNAKLLKYKTTGTLRIGCTDTFSIDASLSRLITSYQDKYPEINIDLESYGFRTLKELYHKGDLDMIFTPEFEIAGYKDSDSLKFQKVELCIAVPSTHPYSNLDTLSITQLKEQPMIAISPKESTLGVNKLKEYCRQFHFEANIVKYVSNLNSLILGVKNGIGITICDSNIHDSQIKTFPLSHQPEDSDIVALWNRTIDSIELDLFINDLQDFLEQRESCTP